MAFSHLLNLLKPFLPIASAAQTGSEGPKGAAKISGMVLKSVYDFWGELKTTGGVLSFGPTDEEGARGEKVESVGYGRRVLLEVWVQGILLVCCFL